jgi:iron complex outermembrane receptor protein
MKKIVLLVLLLGVQERVSAAVQPADSVEMRSGVFTAGEITVTGKKNTAGRRSAPQRWTISTEKPLQRRSTFFPVSISVMPGRGTKG